MNLLNLSKHIALTKGDGNIALTKGDGKKGFIYLTPVEWETQAWFG